jgi:tetratricopeptide (TPR) repeat protein
VKKLSTKQQPFHEVIRILNEVSLSKKWNDVRVLEHTLQYLDYQFGKKVAGIDYRERGDGERISNWVAEVKILYGVTSRLAGLYLQNESLSMIIRNEMSIPHLKGSLSLLNPWLIRLDLDLDASNRFDSPNNRRMNHLLQQLSHIEQNMAIALINECRYDTAEGHCQRCLVYSKRYGLEGEVKTSMIFGALRAYCRLRINQENYSHAQIYAEECYNLVVEAYDPVHFQVQEAAGILINILIKKGDLFDAERYAQVTYSNLRDKKNGMDQEGDEVAVGAYNLARVICRQEGDLVKSEELAREALRLRILIFGHQHSDVGASCLLLAEILQSQGILGDETSGLYKRALAIAIRNEGPDGFNDAIGNGNLAGFYHRLARIQPTYKSKRTHLLTSKSYYEESQRIWSKIDGPTHPRTVEATSGLNTVLRELSQI